MNWIFFALAGSVAQLIDGTLGMGFGLTSSTLLLTLGASAAVASAAVHAAEIGTTLVSGASHWHAENIDKKLFGVPDLFLSSAVYSYLTTTTRF